MAALTRGGCGRRGGEGEDGGEGALGERRPGDEGWREAKWGEVDWGDTGWWGEAFVGEGLERGEIPSDDLIDDDAQPGGDRNKEEGSGTAVYSIFFSLLF